MIPRKKIDLPNEIPTTSMADISFLLILFFMVSTHFGLPKGLSLVLPEPVEVKIKGENITKVFLEANGVVRLDGVEMEVSALKDAVKERLAENEDLVVAMKTERGCPYGKMIEVFDQLKLAEAKKISFVPSKPK